MRDLGILVVQDDPAVSRLIGEELANGGMRLVGPVGGLARAVARAEGEVVDAVVLDLYLPDASGQTTFGRFRGRHPDLAVVVTAPRRFEAEARAAAGARPYLLREELGRGFLVPLLRHAVTAPTGSADDGARARRLLHDLGNALAAAGGESEMTLGGLDGQLADETRELRRAIEESIRLFREFVAARRVEGDVEATSP